MNVKESQNAKSCNAFEHQIRQIYKTDLIFLPLKNLKLIFSLKLYQNGKNLLIKFSIYYPHKKNHPPAKKMKINYSSNFIKNEN